VNCCWYVAYVSAECVTCFMISKIQVQVMADRLPGVHDTCYLYASTGPQIRPRERLESPRRLPLPLTRLNSLCLCCSIRGGVRASCHCRHRLSSPCAIVFEPPALPSRVECHRTPLYLIVTLVVPCYFGKRLGDRPVLAGAGDRHGHRVFDLSAAHHSISSTRSS
jgi:hypothetical protein